jgi:plastocyanin
MKKIILITAALLYSIAGFSVIHTITNSGFTFVPATLTINSGDSVNFVIEAIHQPLEVSQATWDADGITPLPGGFSVPLGGGMVLPDKLTVGTHWYVCSVHVQLTGMKGIIIVNNSTGIPDILPHLDISAYPNPANDLVTIKSNNDLIGCQYFISDDAGRQVLTGIINEETFSINISQFKSGVYLFQVADLGKQSFKIIKN